MEVEVNYWAVLLATVVAMVIGSAWFSPQLFAERWRKDGHIKGDGKSVLGPVLVAVVCNLLTAYVLAHVTYLSNQFFSGSYLSDALTTAFWMWLGFSAARITTYDRFASRSSAYTLIKVGCELVTFLAMGLTIGLMGVK